MMIYKSIEFCQECEEETPHETEPTGRVDIQHGFGHNDDHEQCKTCQKCGFSILEI